MGREKGPEKGNPLFVESLAGETKKGFDDAVSMPGRLDRFSKAHHRALDMADYIRTVATCKTNYAMVHIPDNDSIDPELNRRNIAKRKRIELYVKADFDSKQKYCGRDIPVALKTCGSYLQFRDYFRTGKILLSSMISCDLHMLCPLCAMRRGAKMLKAYLARLEVIRKENPGLQAYLVTLTVKDGGDLLERFNHLQESMQTYTEQRRNAKKGRRDLVEFNKALGAVGSYEFKKGSGSGLWHPHFHAVWLCYEKPDQNLLSREWKAITGDSHIVDVTPFHNQNDVVGGFLEVFKYALKFSDMPLDQNWHGYQTLQKKRLVTSFGLFRGVEVPKNNEDELLDDEPYVDLFYRFIKGTGYSLEKASGINEPLHKIITDSKVLLNQFIKKHVLTKEEPKHVDKSFSDGLDSHVRLFEAHDVSKRFPVKPYKQVSI